MPICFNISYILDIWLIEVPEHASIFCILVLIIASIEAIGYPIITVIRASGKLKGYQLYVSTTLLLSLPTSYIFLRNGYNANTIFICNIIFTFLASITRIIYLRKCIYFNLVSFIKRLFTPILGVTITYFATNILILKINTDNFFSFCIKMLLTIIMSIIIIYYIGLNKYEKNYIKEISQKLKRKIWKKNVY